MTPAAAPHDSVLGGQLLHDLRTAQLAPGPGKATRDWNIFEGMAHALPIELWPQVIDATAETCAWGEGGRSG